jgi:hypothetical protein
MTAWPSDLPQCPVRGLQRQPKPNVVTFGTEVGPAKVRRRSTARTVTHATTFIMTTAQLATFEAFFETTLEDGALPFDWTDRVSGASGSWRIVPGTVPVSVERGPNTWQVDLQLERLP